MYPFTKTSRYLIIGFVFFMLNNGFAQKVDSTSILKKDEPKKHSPKAAALMSAIVPGSGQIYNHKYWKVPIIYGGFVALGYYVNYNQSNYRKYKDAYIFRKDNDPKTNDTVFLKYSDENILTLKNTYQRYRDLGIIGFSLLYVLNIVDATVDAHLFTFDVSPDLSISIRPSIYSSAYTNTYTKGLSLSVKF